MENKKFKVSNIEIPLRADFYLANMLKLTRSQVQKYIEKGLILLNDKPLLKAGIPIKNDDIFIINEVEKVLDYDYKNIEIPILYEDDDLLILNKPINLIVHKTSENDTQFSLHEWLNEKNYPLSDLGDPLRRGIVHRLDKGTSGAIIIAKNNTTHLHLSNQLRERTLGRYYICVIDSALKESQIVELPIIRHPKMRLKYITSKHKDAKSAKTAFFNIETSKDSNLTLLGAKLFSGRTHQIRVHLNAINRHILGDKFYGYKGSFNARILLHAHLMYLLHPKSNEMLHIYAPFPNDFQNFLEQNFNVDSYKNQNNLEIPLDLLYEKSFC